MAQALIGAKLQTATVRGAAQASNNTVNIGGQKAAVKSSNQTLMITPWGAVFAIGFPLYANPPTPFYAGTRWKQVASPSFKMNINPNTAPAVATPVTQWSTVGGNPPAGGFSTPVTIGAVGAGS